MLNNELTSSAPGKVILCGEYSVLQGYPAIVFGVNRRVKASITISDDDTGIVVDCPGLIDSPTTLQYSNHQLTSHHKKLKYLVSLLNILKDEDFEQRLNNSSMVITVDSRELFDGGEKLGLGSSAAMTVALHALVKKVTRKTATLKNWHHLHNTHSKVQGKKGSGADIAASLYGGAITFKSNGEISPYHLPENLHIAFLWSGASASTPTFLATLSSWKQSNESLYSTLMSQLGSEVQKILEAPTAKDVVVGLKGFTDCLFNFAQNTQIPVFASGHEKLYRHGQDMPELVYKPCGAGGGDLGIAVATEEELLKKFVDASSNYGFRRIDLSIDTSGVL